jgi:hypothetical protein
VLSPDAIPERFRMRAHEFGESVTLQITQGQRTLHRQGFRRLPANTSIGFSGEWASQVDFSGDPVKIDVV